MNVKSHYFHSSLNPSSQDAIGSMTQPSNGNIEPEKLGILYTPNVDYCGTDKFTYTISDPTGELSDTATVTVTVVCDEPITPDEDEEEDEGTPTEEPEVFPEEEEEIEDLPDCPAVDDDEAETYANAEVSIPVLDNDGNVPAGEFILTNRFEMAMNAYCNLHAIH